MVVVAKFGAIGTVGFIPSTVRGETYRVWCGLFDRIDNSTILSFIVLQGGPGLSRVYMSSALHPVIEMPEPSSYGSLTVW